MMRVERRARSSRGPFILSDQDISQSIDRKVLRFGDELTDFVSLFGFAGIRQQMLKLASTSQIQADQWISR